MRYPKEGMRREVVFDSGNGGLVFAVALSFYCHVFVFGSFFQDNALERFLKGEADR